MAVGSSSPIRTPLPGFRGVTTVTQQQQYARVHVVLWYLAALGVAGLIGAVMVLLGPTPAAAGWLVFLALIVATLYNPRYGIYILIGVGLAGDGVLAPWYPMMKNLSSVESILYLHDAAIVNPAEVLMGVALVSWLGRAAFTRKYELVLGHLVIPAFIFLAFIAFGFVFGIAQGGDLTIALWASRAIFYMPVMLLLASQLIQTRTHVMTLIWWAAVGMAIGGFNGFWFVATELQWDIKSVLEIAEHSYSIHLNSIFVLLIMLFYFKSSPRLAWFILLTLPFMLVGYIGNQRRAGYVAIAVALLVFGILLQWYNRRRFWMVVPPLLVLFVIYLGIFWNSTSGVGTVAAQVRSIIAPVEGSEEESSNVYRELENANILFTIQQQPVTGVGFGRKFLIIAPMPDISFFAWWEYITHNSILWIWMQAGAGGFLSLLFFAGSTIVLGIRRMFEIPPGNMRAVAFMAVSYVLMHLVYAYVDMSWDGQSMIYVGTMIGLINVLDRIVARPTPTPSRRWPWQRQPEPEPGPRMT